MLRKCGVFSTNYVHLGSSRSFLISMGLLMFCTLAQATVSIWASLQRNEKLHILLCFTRDNECRKDSFLSFMRERVVLLNKLVSEIQHDAVLSWYQWTHICICMWQLGVIIISMEDFKCPWTHGHLRLPPTASPWYFAMFCLGPSSDSSGDEPFLAARMSVVFLQFPMALSQGSQISPGTQYIWPL